MCNITWLKTVHKQRSYKGWGATSSPILGWLSSVFGRLEDTNTFIQPVQTINEINDIIPVKPPPCLLLHSSYSNRIWSRRGEFAIVRFLLIARSTLEVINTYLMIWRSWDEQYTYRRWIPGQYHLTYHHFKLPNLQTHPILATSLPPSLASPAIHDFEVGTAYISPPFIAYIKGEI